MQTGITRKSRRQQLEEVVDDALAAAEALAAVETLAALAADEAQAADEGLAADDALAATVRAVEALQTDLGL